MKLLFLLALLVASSFGTSTGTGSTAVWNHLGEWVSFSQSGAVLVTAQAWNNWTITGSTVGGTVEFSGEDTEGRVFQSKLSGTYTQSGNEGTYQVLLSGQATDLTRNVVLSVAYNLSAYADGSSVSTQITLLGSSAVSVQGAVIGQDYLEATLTPSFSQTQGIFSLFPTSSYPALINYGSFVGQAPSN